MRGVKRRRDAGKSVMSEVVMKEIEIRRQQLYNKKQQLRYNTEYRETEQDECQNN